MLRRLCALALVLLLAGLGCLHQGRSQTLLLLGAGKGASGNTACTGTALTLTAPDNVNDAAWSTRSATITTTGPNTATDPFGLTTASTLKGAASAFDVVGQPIGFTATAGTPYLFTENLKKDAGGATAWVNTGFSDLVANSVAYWFNLTGAGVVGMSGPAGTGSNICASITFVALGWYLIKISGSFSANNALVKAFIVPADGDGSIINDGSQYNAWQVGI